MLIIFVRRAAPRLPSHSPRSRIISLGCLSLAIGRCCRFSFSASFSPSITRVLSFSLALAAPRWTGSYNECLCRQTHSLASWPTMTLLWKYHGRLSRSLACAPRDFERELDSRGEYKKKKEKYVIAASRNCEGARNGRVLLSCRRIIYLFSFFL